MNREGYFHNETEEFSGGEPVLKTLKERHENAPKIEEKKRLSLEDIAAQEGVEIDELEHKFEERFSVFLKKMETTNSYPEEDQTLIDEMYNLYLLSRDENITSKYPWIRNFASFADFSEHFCSDASGHAKAFTMMNIQRFTENAVHPERELQIYGREHPPWGNGDKIYTAEGNWILLPDKFNIGGHYRFAEESVIREIIDLLKYGYKEPDYTHATGSAALKDISSNKAIVGASEALKAGITPGTGEFATYVNHETGKPVTGVLDSVYADKGGPRYGYNSITWFDEYFVTFGINKGRQEDYMRTTDVRYGGYSEDEPPTELSHDTLMNEGTLIGHRVPLSALDVVYSWKKYEDEADKWREENCPQAKLISLEAAQLLKEYGNIMELMAEQEKITLIEAWEKLLAIKK